MACHLFGVPSQAELSGLAAGGNDRFADQQQFAQYRPNPCRPGLFSDGYAHGCDEQPEPYHRHGED